MSVDMQKIRGDFPALSLTPHGKKLVYLDSAASALKPRAVITAMDNFHRFETANVHRGAHYLSDVATRKYEAARETVRLFINAKSTNEIVFTKGTTESLNLVADSFGQAFIREGDEIVLSEMDHHSNIVPWQLMAGRRGAVIRVCPVTEQGEINLEKLEELFNERTKLVAVTQCSNALGTVNDIAEISRMARAVGAKVVVDAAQSVAIMPVDVQKMDCDFLAFSAHKLYGPYGIGVLYGKEDLLNAMPPYQGGGSMISKVSLSEGTTYLPSPHRFEAGTPNIGGAIGMAVAIDYFKQWDVSEIAAHKKELLHKMEQALLDIPGVKIIGTSPTRVNILSFIVEGAHPSDIGNVLDQQGIAVRAGHHCAQPLMERFQIPGTVRASLGIYNNEDDVSALVKGMIKAREILL